MWKVDPTKMCRKHLLGEHVEMHMFVGSLNKGTIKDFPNSRFVKEGLVEVHYLKARHEELVAEMGRRGYVHKTPLPAFEEYVCGSIDVAANEKELGRRCGDCQFENDGLPSSSPRKQNIHKR